MRFPAVRTALGVLVIITVSSCGGGDGPTEPAGPPAAPTGVLVAPAAADGMLSVSWTPVADATSYAVYLASASGVTRANYSTQPDGRRIENATTPAVVTQLDGKVYYVVVTALNDAGESSESTEASGAPNVPLNPTASTTIDAGHYRFTSLNIRTDVLVTANGPVVITVAGNATIDGTLYGNCQAIELRVAGDFTVDGLLTNACTVLPPGGGPDLTVIADGTLLVGSDPSINEAIVSDGSIRLADAVTEDLSLGPIFESGGSPGPAPRPATGPAQQIGSPTLVINRPLGAGKALLLTTRGDLVVGVDLAGGSGKDSPNRNLAPVCDNTGIPAGGGWTVVVASQGGTLAIDDDVTISAGNGGNGGDCTARPQSAGATVTGGPAGDGGNLLLGGQTIVFGDDVTLVRGSGGRGGAALAVAGNGGTPCETGHPASATGGLGGARGEIGYAVTRPVEIVGIPAERGGNGGAGGAATAEGGDGAGCGTTAGNGGAGGSASALGGTGGAGPSGNIWTRGPISHRSGSGGAARSTGGNGGTGADRCIDKQPGGNGGLGGNALATGGPNGGAAVGGTGSLGRGDSFGGNGGNGGDGLGGGTAEAGGTAGSTGDPNTRHAGVPGTDGMLCDDLPTWVLYFGDIPNGNIAPGTNVVIPVFDETRTTQTGTVPTRFKTVAESGQPGVQYVRLNEFLLMGLGKVHFDLDNVVPGFPVVMVEAFVDLECTALNCAQLVGYYNGAEVRRVGNVEVTGPGNKQQLLRLLPPPPGVPYYDAFEFEVVGGGFWINQWNLSIVDP